MSKPWLYLDRQPQVDEEYELDPKEARHAIGAKRLAVGAGVTLFDGNGFQAEAEICEAKGKAVRVRILKCQQVPQPRVTLGLAFAVPKGERQSTLISMATQLGVDILAPLIAARSIVKPNPSAHDRWIRVAREACKQSRRAHLPALCAPQEFSQFLKQRQPADTKMLLDPSGSPWVPPVSGEGKAGTEEHAQTAWVIVGPEGGFDATELELARAGGATVTRLETPILRIETAAIAALTLLAQWRTSAGAGSFS